jgi:hypothetical protein
MSISAISSFSGVDPSQFQRFAGRAQGTPPSPEEFATKMIGDLDTDGDGALSTSEISSAEHPLPDNFLSEVDTDGDGLVTKDELKADMEKRAAEFGDRSNFPPPSLESESGTDLSTWLASATKASTAYQSSRQASSLVQYGAGLSLSA